MCDPAHIYLLPICAGPLYGLIAIVGRFNILFERRLFHLLRIEARSSQAHERRCFVRDDLGNLALIPPYKERELLSAWLRAT